jgi:predicted XRE-type DNA-binding protein
VGTFIQTAMVYVAIFDYTAIMAKRKSEKIELVHGSGNVYRDFGDPDADVKQLKAILAAAIIKALGREKLTVRAAQARTGIAAADFSRIRRPDLKRFTVDRLMTILNRLGSQVDVKIKVRKMNAIAAAA